jgi:hypothetical protein
VENAISSQLHPLSKIPEYNPRMTGDLLQPPFMTIEHPDVLNRFMDVP